MHSWRLPIKFDARPLEADLEMLTPADWVAHFNKREYEGEWSGVALRSVGGVSTRIYPDPTAKGSYEDTPVLSRCRNIQDVIGAFKCPVESVRLLKLAAGAKIREHRDYNLSHDDEELRVHIPICTSPDVLFFVGGVRVTMNAGECWYINVNLPHWVDNRSDSARIHLVIDCVVNDWIRSLLPSEEAQQEPPSLVIPKSLQGEFARFRKEVLEDDALRQRLSETSDKEVFVSLAVELGRARGYQFDAEEVKQALRESRREWTERPLADSGSVTASELSRQGAAEVRPQDYRTQSDQLRGWIPIRLYWHGASPLVDWCHLGTDRFSEPFFGQTIERHLRQPANLLFRHQTPVAMLGERHEQEPGLVPHGFIFHMSRCGSTLISQMLAALPGTIVISEASPIDSVLRANFGDPAVTDIERAQWLQWMISALGQKRFGDEKYFVKFDSWSTISLYLIKSAFPSVPWIFVYRDPVEVMLSQLRQRGIQMLPGVLPPELFGFDLDSALSMQTEEFCARVLATVCESALEHCQDGKAMLINYKQLPEVVWSSALKFFGVDCDETALKRLREVAKLDAKTPSLPFTAAKKQAASEAVRKATERWLAPVYEKLEAMRFRLPE